MPRKQVGINGPPYTKLLTGSALLKTDLLRLCGEFHLPADGSVVDLRTRLRGYINLNRDTLFRNPRYRALFPTRPRIKRPPSSSPTPTHTPTAPSSPALSYAPPSPAGSYASWDGINDDLIPLVQPHQPQIPHQHPPIPPHGPLMHHPPPPSESPSDSDHGSPPPAHAVDGRKFCFFLYAGYQPFFLHIPPALVFAIPFQDRITVLPFHMFM